MSQGPDIQALLAGAGAGGPPPDQGAPAPDQGGGDWDAKLRQALDLIRQVAVNIDGEQTTLDAERITTLIQKMLADAEKEQQELMQGKMSPAAITRAVSG